jgi:ferric-dicitrate binding protein FerR (iron transport regulator)
MTISSIQRVTIAGAAIALVVDVLAYRVFAATIEEDIAGTVARLQGSAIAMQDAVPRILAPDSPVYIGDVLSTGPDSRLEIQMVDDGIFTMGERTTFMVIDYTFGGGTPNGLLRLLSGAVNAASGKLAKAAGAQFTLEANSATIGIRGTDFWAGELDGVFQVGVWSGAVVVKNRGGEVEIRRPNYGTRVVDQEASPTEPQPWSETTILRARALTAF